MKINDCILELIVTKTDKNLIISGKICNNIQIDRTIGKSLFFEINLIKEIFKNPKYKEFYFTSESNEITLLKDDKILISSLQAIFLLIFSLIMIIVLLYCIII